MGAYPNRPTFPIDVRSKPGGGASVTRNGTAIEIGFDGGADLLTVDDSGTRRTLAELFQQLKTSLSLQTGLPSIAAAAALVFTTATTWVETVGYAAANDRGGGLFVRVDSEPAHAGKFRSRDRFTLSGAISATNGGWWERLATEVRPEMFGAFGGDVGAFPPDETAQIQAMADYAMYYGCSVRFDGLGGNRRFGHSKQINWRSIRAPSTLGDLGTNGPPVSRVPIPHFCNHPEFSVTGVGNCAIVALSSMDAQFSVSYTGAPSGSLEPYFVCFRGLKLDGNNLAQKNLAMRYCYRVELSMCRMFGSTQGLYLDHVGVSNFFGNLIYSADTCVNGLAYGDSQFHDNECQSALVGIRLGDGANSKIYANTFTATKLATTTTAYAIQFLSAPSADPFNGTKDVAILMNEFFDYDVCIFGFDGTLDAQRDIYKIKIANNHLVRGINKPNQQFVKLDTVRSVHITDNDIGDAILEYEKQAGVDIQIANASAITIHGNAFCRSRSSAILLANCKGVSIGGNIFCDIARDLSSQPARIELYDCQRVTVLGNAVNDTVPCAPYLVVEHGTSDYNYLCFNACANDNCYVVVGPNTSFGNRSVVQLPRTTGTLPPANTLPVGTQMFITNGSQQTAGATRQPVWSDGSAWRYANGAAA